MVKILYATDLHGSIWKYNLLLKIAIDKHVDMVINGGDMLPNDGDLQRQGSFIIKFLEPYFSRYDKAGIQHLGLLGNDDLRIYDGLFREICQEHPFLYDLAQQTLDLGDLAFVGMNWVVDYPFRLKDRCRKDTSDYTFQRQFGSALLSDAKGWIEIEDWPTYAGTLPTIEDELAHLERPTDPAKAIYVIHMPPADLGLDQCVNGENVGSKAVYRFLEATQPLVSLHGHIHESPECSGRWRGRIGKTVCIQPGQLPDSLTYVSIDIGPAGLKFKRHIVPEGTTQEDES